MECSEKVVITLHMILVTESKISINVCIQNKHSQCRYLHLRMNKQFSFILRNIFLPMFNMVETVHWITFNINFQNGNWNLTSVFHLDGQLRKLSKNCKNLAYSRVGDFQFFNCFFKYPNSWGGYLSHFLKFCSLFFCFLIFTNINQCILCKFRVNINMVFIQHKVVLNWLSFKFYH